VYSVGMAKPSKKASRKTTAIPKAGTKVSARSNSKPGTIKKSGKKSKPGPKVTPKPSAKKKSVQVLSSKLVYTAPVFRVTSDEVIEPSGIKVRRDIIRHPGSVVILASTSARSSHPCS